MAWIVRTLAGANHAALCDRDLFARFAAEGDQSAFAAVAARHTDMVLGVCRRMLVNQQDAEDACQAAFLLLARKAGRVRWQASVANWLFVAARKVANNARLAAARRRKREAAAAVQELTEPVDGLTGRELAAILDEELENLPPRFREPLVLCYLEGLTRDEAAQLLNVTVGALKSQLESGRRKLAASLTSRAYSLGIALLSTAAASSLSARSPVLLDAILVAASGSPSATAAALARCVALKEGLMPMKLGAVALSGIATLALGYGFIDAKLAVAEPPKSDSKPAALKAEAPAPRVVVEIGTPPFVSKNENLKTYFTDDGKTLIAVPGWDGVEFWNPENGRMLHAMPVEHGSIEDSDFSARSNVLALAVLFNPPDKALKTQLTIWLIDTANRAVLRKIAVAEFHVSSSPHVRLTPGGKRVLLGSNGLLRAWDVQSGEELALHKHAGLVQAFEVSPNGKTIIFGSNELYLWNWESADEPRKFATIGGIGLEQAAFSPDGKILYACAREWSDGVAKFDAATGKQIGTVKIPMQTLACSPDGKSLSDYLKASGRRIPEDLHIVLMDSITGQEQQRFPLGKTRASHVSWSPDGSRLAAATTSRLWVWDVKTKTLLGPKDKAHEERIDALTFAPDGRLFTASDDFTIRSWDSTTGSAGLKLTHDGWVRGLAVSPDGALVAGSALRNDLRIWDAKTGAERRKLPGNGEMGGFRIVQFTPDSQRLIAWGDDMYLRVWDTHTGKLIREQRILPDGMTEEEWKKKREGHMPFCLWEKIDISHDGSTFAIQSTQAVRIYDVSTGLERKNMKLGADMYVLDRIALSPDGKRIAIDGHSKKALIPQPDGGLREKIEPTHTIAVCNLATQKPVWQGTCDSDFVRRFTFSPDGSRLAETLDEVYKTKFYVQVWDAANGKYLGCINLPMAGQACAFDAKAKRIAVALSN